MESLVQVNDPDATNYEGCDCIVLAALDRPEKDDEENNVTVIDILFIYITLLA